MRTEPGTRAGGEGPKLLIGFEPTTEGEDALALGAVLAESLGAQPVVIRVFPRPPGLVDGAEIEEELAKEAESATATVPPRLLALAPRTIAVAHDSIGGALDEIASDEEAIGLVVGSGRGGVLGRVLPGSTGQALLHGAPCAVAVAPRGYAGEDRGSLLRVGVGFDGSAESSLALEAAIGIAGRCRSRLQIITVADYVSYGYATSWSVLTAGELRDRELDSKKAILEEAVARVPEEMPVDKRLMRGSPGESLVEASGDLDLLVVGSRAYGPLRRTLLGSASTRLLGDARCPVLVLPRGVGAEPFAGGGGPPSADDGTGTAAAT